MNNYNNLRTRRTAELPFFFYFERILIKKTRKLSTAQFYALKSKKTMRILLQFRERIAEKLLGTFPQILSNAMNKPNGDDLLDMWMNGCISSFEMLKYGLTK